MITTFIFDMGGVLTGRSMREYIHFFAKDEAEEKICFQIVGSDVWKEMDKGLDIDTAMRLLEAQIGDEYDKLIESFVLGFRMGEDPNPEMEALISQLKNRGFKLYLMSNISFLYKRFFPYINSISYMEDIWVSCEKGLVKPQKEAYLDMLHTFGLKPEECFFVDDSEANINAARECGMEGFIYRGSVAELRETLKTYL